MALIRKGNESLLEAARGVLEIDQAASEISTSLASQSEQVGSIARKNQELAGELTLSAQTIGRLKRRLEQNGRYVGVAVGLTLGALGAVAYFG